MSGERAMLRRTDLRSRRTRVAARAMAAGLGVVERLMSRMAAEVPGPADDPFYTAGRDLESLRPGAVLDSRPVVARGFRRPLKADAWQVKFRSTDTRGAAASGVATVLAPRRPFDGAVRPLVSYQCAIDSLGPAADPSYTLRRGTQKEAPLIAWALRRGWAVVTTDYTGPRHAFGAGVVAARFVLDGIRAAIAFEPGGFSADTPIGMWGYSGGAQATLAAAEEQPTYAPELNVVAAVAGGVPVDPTSSTKIFEDGSLFSGLAVGTCIGLSREYPEVDLPGALTPQGRAMVAAAGDMTMEELAATFPFLRWGDYLTVAGVFEIPGMRDAMESIRLGQGAPSTAVFLYHAVHDQNLAVADVDRLAARYQQAGVDVAYRRFRFGEHMIVLVAGVPGALRFLAERFSAPRTRPG